MSDLHYALLAVAGVLLALLYGYNKWQERRMLRELEASLRGGVGDPLMQPAGAPQAAPVVEPARASTATMGTGAPASEGIASDAASAARSPEVEITDLPLSALYGGRIEPRFEAPAPTGAAEASAGTAATAAAGTVPARAPRWVEDPMLDWVLELRCAHAVDGVSVFDAAAPLARMETALPVFLVAWDARSQQWVEPDRFGFYSELLVATQLANRRHRIDEIAASRFIATVQQIAVALDADFDAPDVGRVVATAADLDQLCARFDVQIGLTLNAPAGPWDAARVADAARAAELIPAGPMRWERRAANGLPVFALSAPTLPTDRLALELDVPLAPVAADPLRALFKAADVLAIELGARVIDDNGQPVNAASLSGVAEQLEALYAEMRAAGIEPGDARAQRLYA
jgi:hypothetical protein